MLETAMVFPIVKLLLVAAGAAGVATLIAIDHAKRERWSEGGATRPSDPATRRKAAETALWWSASTLIWGHHFSASRFCDMVSRQLKT
jgi:hypothetical protein